MIIKNIVSDRELLQRLKEHGINIGMVAKFVDVTVEQLELIEKGKANLIHSDKETLMTFYLLCAKLYDEEN